MQWEIRSTTACDLTRESKRTNGRRIIIRLPQPTFCRLSNEILPSWTGFDGAPNSSPTGSYLCALVLGWSYVLSARLVEQRKHGDEDKVLSYTDNRATASAQNSTALNHRFLLPVGDADERELRWWTAVLAKGCGWRATLTRLNKEYLSPWACHLNEDTSFTLLHGNAGSTSTSTGSLNPPVFSGSSKLSAQTRTSARRV